MNKEKILMCSYPNVGRGPGNAFYNHLNAIKNSKIFDIELLSNEHLQNTSLFGEYDVFWFTVRFHQNIYYFLKENFPSKKFIMGPNVLFEKAEIGPSDEWERWFVENVSCDFYFNKAQFYLDRVMNFFKGSRKYDVLPNCLELKNLEGLIEKNKNNKTNKALIYSKKRRIDKSFDRIFPRFLQKLTDKNIDYDVITYGSYKKEDLINNSYLYNCCFWFSIEDFCSNAQLELQSVGIPIIGTPYNTTHTFDKKLITQGAILNEETWISWKENVDDLYIDCYLENYEEFNNTSLIESRIDYIKNQHSYDAYVENLNRIINE